MMLICRMASIDAHGHLFHKSYQLTDGFTADPIILPFNYIRFANRYESCQSSGANGENESHPWNSRSETILPERSSRRSASPARSATRSCPMARAASPSRCLPTASPSSGSSSRPSFLYEIRKPVRPVAETGRDETVGTGDQPTVRLTGRFAKNGRKTARRSGSAGVV